MKRGRLFTCTLAAALVGGALFSAGRGQTAPAPGETIPTITNGLAHEDVAASASRSPGHMVSAGLISAQNAVKFGRTNAAEITATAPEEEPDFFTQVATVFREVINNLLMFLVNLFLERAGLPGVDGGIINGNTNDNTNTNTNTNTNNNDNANDNDNTNGNNNANANDNANGNTNVNDNQNDNAPGGIGGNDVSNDNTTRPGGLRKNR